LPNDLSTGSALVALALILTACGGGGGGEPPPLADAGELDAGPDLPEGPGIAGFMRDSDGQLLGNEQVLACMATTCLFGDTDADGFFSFAIEPDADVALKTTGDSSTEPRRGSALCPIDIRDDELIYVGTLYVPLLPEGVAIGPIEDDPQTLEPGDGLELSLSRADLTPRVGDSIVDAASRLVAPEQVCPDLVIPGEEILAVYALHPFGATSSSPMAVRAPSELAAGTEVHFRAISEIDGHFSDPALGRADGTAVATDAGAGITELSWLVISRP
jgi:hypothetical protein